MEPKALAVEPDSLDAAVESAAERLKTYLAPFARAADDENRKLREARDLARDAMDWTMRSALVQAKRLDKAVSLLKELRLSLLQHVPAEVWNGLSQPGWLELTSLMARIDDVTEDPEMSGVIPPENPEAKPNGEPTESA